MTRSYVYVVSYPFREFVTRLSNGFHRDNTVVFEIVLKNNKKKKKLTNPALVYPSQRYLKIFPFDKYHRSNDVSLDRFMTNYDFIVDE